MLELQPQTPQSHIDESERGEQNLVCRIGKVLELIIDALPDSEEEGQDEDPESPKEADGLQTMFGCKAMPEISATEFVRRFTRFGEIPAGVTLIALIVMDKALKTKRFTLKSTVFK